jgi:hypothetical protein
MLVGVEIGIRVASKPENAKSASRFEMFAGTIATTGLLGFVAAVILTLNESMVRKSAHGEQVDRKRRSTLASVVVGTLLALVAAIAISIAFIGILSH